MLSPEHFIGKLQDNSVCFFAGVPDSLLKNVCAYITDTVAKKNNIIAANEGAAVGLAAGYYLSTGNIPLVYMQNSGIGNVVNPLLSLMDKDVYNMPMLMLIGWRGEPGVKDEPQHVKQGKVTLKLLEAMGVEYEVLSKDTEECDKQIERAVKYMKTTKEPFALVVRKDTFEDYKLKTVNSSSYELSREDAIKLVVNSLRKDDIVVSTTGMTSRELFEYREERGEGHECDFLTVGSMGHSSQIALGIALQKKDRRVVCFDGDGALLMHAGSMAIIGSMKPENYVHIVFNNGAHDSVGGQPTVGFEIDMCDLARANGYRSTLSIEYAKNITDIIDNAELPAFIEIRVKKGARKNLGRPTTTPIENKEAFMNFLKD